MAHYNKELIREKLAPMLRGKGVAHFRNVMAVLMPHGDYAIIHQGKVCLETASLKEAVDCVYNLLN